MILTCTYSIASDVASMEKIYGCDLQAAVLQCLLWWTCNSVAARAGLLKMAIITPLMNFLRQCIQFNFVEKVK